MKKYLIILVVVAVASMASCKKFLEEKQVSNLTQEYYNSEAGLESLVNGLYVYARVKHEWDGNGTKLIEPETDAYMHQDANLASMANSAYGNSTSTIANNVNNFLGAANSSYAPMGAYPHINNCNIALDIIDNLKPGKFGSDETFRLTRRSEILFLRAWAYYLISNQLGDVPLLLAPQTDARKFHFPKAKLEDIYKQIISDVRYAYDNLPAEVERGRISKWAAGHLLAKLYLNRAQAAAFQNSGESHLKRLYKGNVATDLDSVITLTTAVINGVGPALAPDYWSLFDPKVSETSPHKEVIWAAQFDVNLTLNGRFRNRSCNYHTGNYTNASGVARSMAYGRPFSTYKPTDWAYDNFHDKVNDSRYYKTFQYEYVANGGSNSFSWSAAAANWWNANKPAGEPAAEVDKARIQNGKRAIIYLENSKDEALDSTMVMSLPYQFMVRWVRSAVTGKYYYRLFIDGSNIGLANGTRNIYLSSKKWIDPMRGGSADPGNYDQEAGTRDAILMRLAETYLIRAEAYGRKGMYGQAVADINVLRQRAAYKGGENRPDVLVQWEPGAAALTNEEKQPPYTAEDSYTKIMVSEAHFTPGTAEAQAEGYIPTVNSKEQMFIHFIYNEKAREFLSEGLAWEDQHNAGILYDRVYYHNQMASNLSGGWPVADNPAGVNGQNGNGKGQISKNYTFRPWPDAFLQTMTDENGNPLSAEAKQAYQNEGY